MQPRSRISVVVLALVAATCAPLPSPTPSPTTPTTAPSASPSSPPNATMPPVLAMDWGDPVVVTSDFGATIMDSVGGPDGVVAVGSVLKDGRITASVWHSQDGLTWSTAESDPSFGGRLMVSVTTGGPGFIAVGIEIASAAPDAAPVTARASIVWTSVDGATWMPVPTTADPDGATMRLVASSSDLLVATGSRAAVTAGGCSQALSWTSTDGLVWARVPADPDLACAAIGAVVAGGPGFVAFGSRSSPEGGLSTAAAWTSVDGRAWDLAPQFSESLDASASFVDAAVGPPGIVAVLKAAAGSTVRISTDGRSWHDGDGRSWYYGTGDQVRVMTPSSGWITWVDGGFVVAGPEGMETSPDGRSWTSHGPPPNVSSRAGFIGHLANLDGRLVAFGSTGRRLFATISPMHPSPQVSAPVIARERAVLPTNLGTAAPRGLAVGPGGIVAVGFDRPPDLADGLAVWHSGDGLSWRLLPIDLGWGYIEAVTAVGDGFAAVGEVRAIRPGTTGSLPEAGVWVSIDGMTWERAAFETPEGESYGRRLIDIVAGGPGLVVVGSAAALPGQTDCVGGTIGVWTSDDGTMWARADDPDLSCGTAHAAASGSPWTFVAGSTPRPMIINGRDSGTMPIPAIWSSVDGTAWERAWGAESQEPGDVVDIATGPGGSVAIVHWGLHGVVEAEFLISTDGRTWRPAGDPASFESGTPIAIAAGSSGFLAVGAMGLTFDDWTGPAAWWSRDGRSWVRVIGQADAAPDAGERAEAFFDVEPFGDRFIVLGTSGSTWVLTPPPP